MELSDYVYTCSAGETFDSVARTVYGDENYAPELLCSNPEQSRTLIFKGGEVLLLPVIEIPEETDNTDGLPETAPWRSDS